MINMKIIKIVFFGLSLGLAGCSEEIEFDLKESGMSAVEGSINWLDNERVIFVNKKNNKGKIYIWNTNTDDIELYAPEATGGICYSDRYITYGEKVENRTTYIKTGLMGEEELIVFNWDDKELRKYEKNKYSCKRFVRPLEHKGRLISYLREDHGYVDKGINRKDEYQYPVYVNAEGKRFQLPLKSTHYQFPNGFYDFKEAYFIWHTIASYTPWKSLGCVNALWLYTDGKMELICFPYREEFKHGSIQVFPVKEGYLLIVHNFDDVDKPGDSGVYYFNDSVKYENKLLIGKVDGVSISGNGCNVAFTFQDNLLIKSTLKMLNVCKGI